MIHLTMNAWLGNLFIIVIGLIIGSFLNVVVARLPHRLSIIRPASRCAACLKPIRWSDNIPVLSYLLLRGRCRSCGVGISVRYPVIELLTALLFLAAKVRFGFSTALLVHDLPFLAVLVAVTFIDLEHRIIPDRLSLGGLVYGLVISVVVPGSPISWLGSFTGAAMGFGLFFGLAWIYEKTTGRSGLGGGDVKLLAMIGAFLGIGGVFSTILISSIFGSIAGVVWALYLRSKQPASENASGGLLTAAIPYGPFLVIGAIYYLLLGDVLWLPFTNLM